MYIYICIIVYYLHGSVCIRRVYKQSLYISLYILNYLAKLFYNS